MDRKEFIKTCGSACLGFSAFGIVMQGCASSKRINVAIEGENMILPISAFEIEKKGMKKLRSYIIAQNERLQYPICVYHLGSDDYAALLMRCSHQGTELQVFGDKLHCPAHGSEFSNEGTVTNGPASSNLRSFPITVDNNQLKIALR